MVDSTTISGQILPLSGGANTRGPGRGTAGISEPGAPSASDRVEISPAAQEALDLSQAQQTADRARAFLQNNPEITLTQTGTRFDGVV